MSSDACNQAMATYCLEHPNDTGCFGLKLLQPTPLLVAFTPVVKTVGDNSTFW